MCPSLPNAIPSAQADASSPAGSTQAFILLSLVVEDEKKTTFESEASEPVEAVEIKQPSIDDLEAES